MTIHLTQEVFTPSKPARIAFVERDSVNERLVNALNTPGKQIVVYGHSGTGKTTLLANKLHQIYGFHITTRCMKGLSFEQLVLDAFDKLSPFYINEKTNATKNSLSSEVTASYFALNAKVVNQKNDEQSVKQSRVLPPQITPQALGQFLGNSKGCWVIEDFHKIDDSEKEKLSQLMKVFMDLADEYTNLKIIAIGAVDTARQVINYDLEMRNRVAEVNVTLMSEEEIIEIVTKGENALNIKFSNSIKKKIAVHSNGLASVCHNLCLSMCRSADIIETVSSDRKDISKENFDSALKSYIEESSDSIKHVFDKALKERRKTTYDNARLILSALSKMANTGGARRDILKKIQEEEINKNYPEQNLKNYLNNLCGSDYGNILRCDSNAGLYSYSEPIFRSYAIAFFENGGTGVNTIKLPPDLILKILEHIKLQT